MDLITEIKKRSRQFVDDNIADPIPQDYLFAESAALIGASVQNEVLAEEYAESAREMEGIINEQNLLDKRFNN